MVNYFNTLGRNERIDVACYIISAIVAVGIIILNLVIPI